MRRTFRLTGSVLLLLVLVSLPALAAEKASTTYKKAKQAEARQDYETAYMLYKEVYDQHPEDVQYQAAVTRVRLLAATQLVHKGQLLRDQGHLDQALGTFQHAALIDPALDIARQEIRRTQDMINKAAPPKSENAPRAGPLSSLVENAAGPMELAPVSGAPISFRFADPTDVKFIYSFIGQSAGINVMFDSDFTQSRAIRLELNDVSLLDALQSVAMASHTFWRPVTPNTIYVAQDTPAKRAELEQNVVKTFYLANLGSGTTASADLQEIRQALQGTMQAGQAQFKINSITSQDALVVRGTPDQVALAEKILNDVDKPRPEVVVQVIVMQVTLDKLRNMGILPPNSASVSLIGNVSTTTPSSSSSTTSTTSTTTTSSNAINLNNLAHLNATDFSINITGDSTTGAAATLNFLMSDNSTKIIQQPELRAVNGQKASLKIGDRVPVATGSFGAGLGGVGLNSLVNTQFQYIDVGVNIDMTPWVQSSGREVTLHIALDISSVTGTSNIGGIQQPTIGQRKIEHDIRLRDGEVNLIGGLLETDLVKNVQGYPWLSQIPILKYLFSSESKEKTDTEVVFAIIPHIVRSQVLTDLNLRAIDVGTQNVTDIRRSTYSGAQQPTPVPQTAPQGTPSTPSTALPQAGQPAPAVVNFNPPQVVQAVGSTFSVGVVLTGQNIFTVPAKITYDPHSLELVNVTGGDFLAQGGQAVTVTHRDDLNQANQPLGAVQVTAARPPNTGGASGQGEVFTLTFRAKAAGQSAITVTAANVRDVNMQPVPVTGSPASVTIK